MSKRPNATTMMLRGLAVLAVAGVALQTATSRADKIQDLLRRRLPTAPRPTTRADAARHEGVSPFKPLDRLPFYGLSHRIVDTSTGRLAFRIQDKVYPGSLQIFMARAYDSGLALELPPPLAGTEARSSLDFGPNWSLAYSDYIQEVSGYLVLGKTDEGTIKYVLQDPESTTYIKDKDFPSTHLTLERIDESTLDEYRSDGSVWRFVKDFPTGYYLLSWITDRHGNWIGIGHEDGCVTYIENSSGSWVTIEREGLFLMGPEVSETFTPQGEETLLGPQPVQMPSALSSGWTRHRVTAIYDSSGGYFSFSYDPGGRLTAWYDSAGKHWGVSSDVSGRLGSATNPMNQVVLSATYNTSSRVSSLAMGSGATTFSYDTSNRHTTATDPRGNPTLYSYNLDGVTTSVQTANGASISFSLDAARNITTAVTGGHTHSFLWNAAHHLLSYTAPSDQTPPTVWSYEYDALERLVRATTPNGTRTYLSYNASSDVVTEALDTNADGTGERIWSATYDTYGNMTALTNPRGYTTSYAYNGLGLLISVGLPTTPPHTTALEYDAAGRVTTVSRPITASTEATWMTEYDSRGMPVLLVSPDEVPTSLTYDDAGRLVSVSDGLGNVKQFGYDAASRLVLLTDPIGHSTHYSYDLADNLTTVVDAANNNWIYSYNNMNRLAASTDPLGRTNTLLYGEHGGVTSETFPSGRTVNYVYDGQDRLIRQDYPDGSSDHLEYERGGLPSGRAHMGVGHTETVSLGRNGFGEITWTRSIVQGDAEPTLDKTLSYEYDLNGNRTAMEVQGEDRVTYEYDSLDRLTETSSTLPTRGLTSIAYDPWSLNRVSISFSPSNEETAYGYDPAGRLEWYALHSNGVQVLGRTFSRDAAGRIQSVGIEEGVVSREVDYQRDPAGRIVEADYGNALIDEWEYDAVGHITSLSRSGQTLAPSYEASFNAAGEPEWVTTNSSDVLYIYNHVPSSPAAALEIERSSTSGAGEVTSRIAFGHDGTVLDVSTLDDATGQFNKSEEYRWLVGESEHLMRRRSLEQNAWINTDFLPDFRAPWGQYQQSTLEHFYPADYPADKVSGIRPSNLKAETPLQRGVDGISPAEGTRAMHSRMPEVFAGGAVSIFASRDDLTHSLGRTWDSPAYFQRTESFASLPRSGYFDPILGDILAKPALGEEPFPHAPRDSVSASSPTSPFQLPPIIGPPGPPGFGNCDWFATPLTCQMLMEMMLDGDDWVPVSVGGSNNSCTNPEGGCESGNQPCLISVLPASQDAYPEVNYTFQAAAGPYCSGNVWWNATGQASHVSTSPFQHTPSFATSWYSCGYNAQVLAHIGANAATSSVSVMIPTCSLGNLSITPVNPVVGEDVTLSLTGGNCHNINWNVPGSIACPASGTDSSWQTRFLQTGAIAVNFSGDAGVATCQHLSSGSHSVQVGACVLTPIGPSSGTTADSFCYSAASPTGHAGTFSWLVSPAYANPSSGAQSGTSSTFCTGFTAEGTYNVGVTFSETGMASTCPGATCIGAATVTVTPPPPQVSINPPNPTNTAANQTITKTATGVPSGGTYSWSITGSSSILSILGPANASVVSLRGMGAGSVTLSVQYTTSGGTDTKQITVNVLDVETRTMAVVPANRARRDVGVGETVELTVRPLALGPVTWSPLSPSFGTLSSGTGNPVTFTAPDSATTSTITVTCSGVSQTVTFNVFEPTTLTAVQTGQSQFPAGMQGAGMQLQITVQPTTVSFQNVELWEVSGPATNVQGWFLRTPPIPANVLAHAASPPMQIPPGNTFPDSAEFSNWQPPPPWASGSFEWDIPVRWRVLNNATVHSNIANHTQKMLILDALGTSRVEKLGQVSVPRPP